MGQMRAHARTHEHSITKKKQKNKKLIKTMREEDRGGGLHPDKVDAVTSVDNGCAVFRLFFFFFFLRGFKHVYRTADVFF